MIEFAILTTTYERKDELERAILSVRTQNYQNYKHIIVNDSPSYDYGEVVDEISQDTKIKYFVNKENKGKNFSLNLALDYLVSTKFYGYIIFLDDDDWLAPDALSEIAGYLETEGARGITIPWLVTERKILNDKNERIYQEKKYSYFKDYLLGKKITGDKTHVINMINATSARFSRRVKNGEEWYFFLQLGITFQYKNFASTLSNGYAAHGLTEDGKKRYSSNTFLMLSEIKTLLMFTFILLRTLSLPWRAIQSLCR